MDVNAAISVFRIDPAAAKDALDKYPNLITDVTELDHRTLLHFASGYGLFSVQKY